MLEHKKIHDLDDFFLELGKRPEKAVYFYRINGFNEKIEDSNETIEMQMTAIIEDEFLRFLNAERVRIGVKPLVKNDILTKAAMVRAQENITSLSHTRPNGKPFSDILSNEFTYEYKWSGENLAYVITGPHSSTDYTVAFNEQSLKDLAKKFYDMFADDAPHYNNMTRDYFEEIGVGIAFYKNESKKTIRVVCSNRAKFSVCP
mgnify:CR=1 FL=1